MMWSNRSLLTGAALLVSTLALGCDDGRLNVGGLCSSEADCPPGQMCQDGHCTATCSTAEQCLTAKAGVQCVDNHCVGTLLPLINAPATIGEGAVVKLDASETVFIGDGDPTFEWKQLDGPTVEITDAGKAIAQITTPAVLEETTLSFEVSVTGGGETLTGTVDVTVANSVNEPPEATLAAQTETIAAGGTVELDASASSDPNPSDSLSFSWEPADLVTPGEAGYATFTAPDVTEKTSYDVTVTISDGADTATATVSIEVTPGAVECPGGCDDGDPCTEDTCDAKSGCTNTPLSDVECDDGDACTIGTICSAGVCGGGAAKDCDDADPCTDDACDAQDGCKHAQNEAPCTDGNACTDGDACKEGKCVPGGPKSCDDLDPCTTDACTAGECTHTTIEGACDDGDACTTGDTCTDGICIGSGEVTCEDDNACTVDSCDPATGCVYEPNDDPCEDGDPCTLGDTCVEGDCLPGDIDKEKCGCEEDADCLAMQGEGWDYCNGTLYCDTTKTTPLCVIDPTTVVLCDISKDTPCEKQACDPGTGFCLTTPVPNGTVCDDSSACTQGDVCEEGLCAGGPPIVCDDGNPCTTDACDAFLGCTHELNTDPCEDGNLCTANDICNNGVCTGAEVLCGDANPCTKDSCDPEVGCKNEPAEAECDDGNPCTSADICDNGGCLGAAATVCDDGNPCTDDGCDPALGCTTTVNTTACDDGDPCTVEDHCSQGQCQGTAPLDCNDDNACTTDGCGIEGCTHTPNDATCDDSDPCTAFDVCTGGECVSTAPLVCDDGNPCTQDLCDAVAGCLYEPTDGPCDDQNACTTVDQCTEGSCVGAEPQDCNDENPCTDDACDPAVGCVHAGNAEPCEDGDICTQGDACMGGECVGGASLSCDDGNPCTDDACDALTGCGHSPVAGACSDGNACTEGDACTEGVCTGATTLNCDDGNPCTDDTCDAETGCAYKNNQGSCDDGDACTVGTLCSGGACVGNPIDCNDDNACTDDSCDSALGCQHANAMGPCDDGNGCTDSDTCTNGVCKGVGLQCDDGNPCTDDSCDGVDACTYTANTKSCDDGNACTTEDRCEAEACSGKALVCNDGNPCTDDTCDMATGCKYTNNVVPCDDGNACTKSDVCEAGKCKSGAALQCDDGNPCTNDSCNPATGCVATNNTTPCDDGSACTTGDACSGGACKGTAVTCNDGNPCTTDTCAAATGCKYTNNTLPCDDSNKCTSGDTCGAGKCVGAAVSCNDGNACTNDSCDALVGCKYVNNTAPCNDNDACTTHDACDGGSCVGEAVICEGGGACITVSCDPLDGCVSSTVTGTCSQSGEACTKSSDCTGATEQCVSTPCDDGNVCTTKDVCSSGTCVGTVINCDDGNPCTVDSCTGVGGCAHAALKNGAACNDGDLCTTSDMCLNGACFGVFKCDDSNPCTSDSCAAGTCSNKPQSAPCDDGNLCTINDSCANGQCAGTPKSCSDGNQCTADSCDSATGCKYAPAALGTACSVAGESYSMCWDGSCVSWQVQPTSLEGATSSELQGLVTPPSNSSLQTVGSYTELVCGTMCYTVVNPAVFKISGANVVAPVSSQQGSVPYYDADGYMVVGYAENTLVWDKNAWVGAGLLDLQTWNVEYPVFRAVSAYASSPGTVSHWLGGRHYGGGSFYSLARSCTWQGDTFMPLCDIMPVLEDGGAGCSTQIDYEIRDIAAAAGDRVFYAGTETDVTGNAAPAIASWNGNTFTACGSLSGYKGEIYLDQDAFDYRWKDAPSGAQLEVIEADGTKNVLSGGTEGSLLSFDGDAWTAVYPTETQSLFNNNFDIYGILLAGDDVHVVGNGTGVSSPSCNTGFYMHGTRAGTKLTFNRLIKFSNDVYACGKDSETLLGLRDVRLDPFTGDIVVVGFVGSSAANPTASKALVMRLVNPNGPK